MPNVAASMLAAKFDAAAKSNAFGLPRSDRIFVGERFKSAALGRAALGPAYRSGLGPTRRIAHWALVGWAEPQAMPNVAASMLAAKFDAAAKSNAFGLPRSDRIFVGERFKPATLGRAALGPTYQGALGSIAELGLCLSSEGTALWLSGILGISALARGAQVLVGAQLWLAGVRTRRPRSRVPDLKPPHFQSEFSTPMPMSDTLDLIHRYYTAFNRGDRETLLALLSEGVVHDLNQGARETGRETFRAFMQRMDRCYAEQLTDIVVMVSEDGRRAAAEYIVHGEYKADDDDLPPARGQRYVLPGGAFFVIENGYIARVTNYYNLQDWIAQVQG